MLSKDQQEKYFKYVLMCKDVIAKSDELLSDNYINSTSPVSLATIRAARQAIKQLLSNFSPSAAASAAATPTVIDFSSPNLEEIAAEQETIIAGLVKSNAQQTWQMENLKSDLFDKVQ